MNARAAEEPAGWEFRYKSLSLNVYAFNPCWARRPSSAPSPSAFGSRTAGAGRDDMMLLNHPVFAENF